MSTCHKNQYSKSWVISTCPYHHHQPVYTYFRATDSPIDLKLSRSCASCDEFIPTIFLVSFAHLTFCPYLPAKQPGYWCRRFQFYFGDLSLMQGTSNNVRTYTFFSFFFSILHSTLSFVRNFAETTLYTTFCLTTKSGLVLSWFWIAILLDTKCSFHAELQRKSGNGLTCRHSLNISCNTLHAYTDTYTYMSTHIHVAFA